MKRLYILRHAKSSWATPGLGDIQRPLNNRGQKQVVLLRDWFKNESRKPELVLCSPALRTIETYEGIVDGLDQHEFQTNDDLYISSLETYLSILWTQTADSLLLIGHNPTCDELARYLTTPSSPAMETLMANHFGTATLAVLDFDGEAWNALGQASCSLQSLLRPKMLEAAQKV